MPVELTTRICACGCGEPFKAKGHRKYIAEHYTDAFQQSAWRRNRPEQYKAKRQRDKAKRRVWSDEQLADYRAKAEARRALGVAMAAVGVRTVKVVRSEIHMLGLAWRRITAWCEFSNCPAKVTVGADPTPVGDRFIYGLVDPRTRLVRYVGLTTTGMKRPRQHRRPAPSSKKYHSTRWVESLRRLGMTFEIVILEECPSEMFEDLCALEVWWIAYGRACGWDLTNMTDGGEGTLGHQISDEERVKRGERAVALWSQPEYRSKVTHNLKLISDPEAARDRALRRWQNPTYRAAQTAVLRAVGKRGAAGKSGEASHMKRDDVRTRQREAMRVVGRRRRTLHLAKIRAEFAAIVFESLMTGT